MSEPDVPSPNGPFGERFRLGRVVARSFAIWLRELPLLLALALVLHAPRLVLDESLTLVMPDFPQRVTRGRDREPLRDRFNPWLRKAIPIQAASSLVRALFTDLSLALIVFAVCARLRGEKPAFGESLRGGARRFLPVLRVSLCLFVLQALVHYADLCLLLLHLVPVGLALLVVRWTPLLITLLLSPFWVAVPAAVVEQPRKLLRRSWRLTRGHRLAVCGGIL